MQKKIFWLSFIVISTIADIALPLVWALVATLPILFFCWWMTYRSDWFE